MSRMDPITGHRPRTRLGRQFWRVRHQIRRALGMRGSFVTPEGVRYAEVTPDLLGRALSRKGVGYKDYDVTFPDRSEMRIRCTQQRVYADLMGPRGIKRYLRIDPLLRPGMRVLEVGTTTGYTSAYLAGRVGPSGGVVALGRDEEGLAFARSRYPHANIAFEAGAQEGLAGETAGAFGGAIAVDAIREGDDDGSFISELWRVVGPDGWLVVAAPTRRAKDRTDQPAPKVYTQEEFTRMLRDAIGVGAPEAESETGGGGTEDGATEDAEMRPLVMVDSSEDGRLSALIRIVQRKGRR